MWWNGRIPGLPDEEDQIAAEEDKKLENLGFACIHEIIDLLSANGYSKPVFTPSIQFQRVPLKGGSW